jgi:hypothetical protein
MKRVTVICFAQWITQIKMSRRFGPKLIAPRDDVRRKFFPQMGIDVRGGVQEATRQRKSSTKLKYLALRQLKQWKPPKKVMSILSAGKVRKTLLIDYLTQRSNVLTGESYTNKKNHEKPRLKKENHVASGQLQFAATSPRLPDLIPRALSQFPNLYNLQR